MARDDTGSSFTMNGGCNADHIPVLDDASPAKPTANDQYTYTCADGFTLVTGRSYVRTNCKDNKWTPLYDLCETCEFAFPSLITPIVFLSPIIPILKRW